MHKEDTFQIKTFNDVHTCARSLINRHTSAKWVAEQYAERFKSQPDWPISSIIETVRREYTLNISEILSYRARRIAREMNDGCDMDQYKQLWSYAEEIRRTNPSSTFKVKVDRQTPSSNTTFCKAYMCFDACKQGILSGGRPLLCLNGCHLKGQCPGHLLTAVGINANDGIYPVAVAVVESECTDSWEWFLKLVVADLGLNNGSGWTFISDQQKGLVKTLKDNVPHAEMRFCLRHMYSNFKKQFQGKLFKDAMMSASRAPTKHAFEQVLTRLSRVDEIDLVAYQHLKGYDPKVWAKHAFSHAPKCDIALNNLSESFNAVLLPAWDKPILTMLETIRKIIMTRLSKKHKTMEDYVGLLCPKIKNKVEKLKHDSRIWFPLLARDGRFEVSNLKEQYVVDVNEQTCACSLWGLTGIPCVHATCCLLFMKRVVEKFVHPYYHRETYMTMYSHFIHPINGLEMWPEVTGPEMCERH